MRVGKWEGVTLLLKIPFWVVVVGWTVRFRNIIKLNVSEDSKHIFTFFGEIK